MRSSVPITSNPAWKDTCGLGLGCFWARNRRADEGELSTDQCKARELALFAEPQWASFSKLGQTGVDTLKSALQMPLKDLAKEIFHGQRAAVLVRLSSCNKGLLALGSPRDTPNSQREYLMERVSKFERLASAALEGHYGTDRSFSTNAVYRLVTNISDLDYEFGRIMRQRGHLYSFKRQVDDDLADSRSEDYLEALKQHRAWAAACGDPLIISLRPETGGEDLAFMKPNDGIMTYLANVASMLPRRGLQLAVSLKPSESRGMLTADHFSLETR